MIRMWWHQRKMGHTPELRRLTHTMSIYTCSGCTKVWPAPRKATPL